MRALCDCIWGREKINFNGLVALLDPEMECTPFASHRLFLPLLRKYSFIWILKIICVPIMGDDVLLRTHKNFFYSYWISNTYIITSRIVAWMRLPQLQFVKFSNVVLSMLRSCKPAKASDGRRYVIQDNIQRLAVSPFCTSNTHLTPPIQFFSDTIDFQSSRNAWNCYLSSCTCVDTTLFNIHLLLRLLLSRWTSALARGKKTNVHASTLTKKSEREFVCDL